MRTFTELRSEAKKLKVVSSGNFTSELKTYSQNAARITKPTAAMKPLVKEILQLRDYCQSAHDAASEAQKILRQKFDWFEGELRSLTK